MSSFRIKKSTYKSKVLIAGRYQDQPIYTQFDVYNQESGVIFFRFRQLHKKYLTDKEIQCTPEWEEIKEQLPNVLEKLSETEEYSYNVLYSVIREHKLKQLLA
jgi:hypothetical protein